ncbi:hypothetical protein LAWI1_G005058, partial [Lachnellula willkommii]
MATQGSSASAVSRGGSGPTSTPANNVGGDSASTSNRRVSPLSLPPPPITLKPSHPPFPFAFPHFFNSNLLTNYLFAYIQSSGTQNTLFSGLVNQKRNSTDAAAQARKESFSDQKPATGIIGKMWN